jgi:isocitrate dehydrogenase (NAD+)
MGEDAIISCNNPLPEELIKKIKDKKIAIKGPTTTPIGEGFSSVNVAIRKKLDLYANIRPIKSFEGVKALYEDIDLVIVRENTEGLYSGIEHMVGDDAAEAIKIITRKASERICRHAFELARFQNRKKVTLVHKANIMKLTDGLFLRCGREIAKEYTDINFEDVIIDAMCMKLVQNPQTFDVIVAPNLYGDILSDLAAGLIGGLGFAPGANIGDEIAVFEPVHGTAPDIKGKNIANPTSAILSGVMMLRYIGENDSANRIENALKRTLKDNSCKTCDLGGNLTTKEYTELIIKNLV